MSSWEGGGPQGEITPSLRTTDVYELYDSPSQFSLCFLQTAALKLSAQGLVFFFYTTSWRSSHSPACRQRELLLAGGRGSGELPALWVSRPADQSFRGGQSATRDAPPHSAVWRRDGGAGSGRGRGHVPDRPRATSRRHGPASPGRGGWRALSRWARGAAAARLSW